MVKIELFNGPNINPMDIKKGDFPTGIYVDDIYTPVTDEQGAKLVYRLLRGMQKEQAPCEAGMKGE